MCNSIYIIYISDSVIITHNQIINYKDENEKGGILT